MWLVSPPEQHEYPDVKPEGTPDKIASEQMNKRLEPRGNGETKREPIEQHNGHEEYCDGPHSSYQFSVFVISTAACAVRSAACAVPVRTLMPQLMMRASSRFIFTEYAQIATAMLRHRNKVLSTRPSQLDHDRPCHAWVQGAEILVGSRLGEGEGIAIVRVQRDRLE